MLLLDGLHLRSIEVLPWPERLNETFPFTVPVLRSLGKLVLRTPITFLVGENGSGKSTLLEAVACTAGSTTVGAENAAGDPSLSAVHELSKYIRLVWTKRTHKGFYLRAEDFFGYARRMAAVRVELEQDLHTAAEELRGHSLLAQMMGVTPYKQELGAMRQRYGEGLDSQSHGESFLLLFQQRFIPGGLYLLDEPEAPLSPLRQMALLAILKKMVAQEAQFLIATHSPILMAMPGAQILNLEGGKIEPADYESLEHVRLTRDFLNNPQAYLRRLEEDDES
jgi:predicted ATPase